MTVIDNDVLFAKGKGTSKLAAQARIDQIRAFEAAVCR